MTKPNYRVKHFRDPRYPDQPSSRIVINDDPIRLHFRYFIDKGGWDTVARFVLDRDRWPVAWIPDANVAILTD